MKLPNWPSDHQIATADGQLRDPWWLFFDGVQRLIRFFWQTQRLVDDRTLTAASTTITPPLTETAGELVVILRQDATGGRAVVWGTGFAGACGIPAEAQTASTISTFRFVYSADAAQWVMVGQPTTGMTA